MENLKTSHSQSHVQQDMDKMDSHVQDVLTLVSQWIDDSCLLGRCDFSDWGSFVLILCVTLNDLEHIHIQSHSGSMKQVKYDHHS